MRFLLTAQLAREAREFSLRAGCRDCFFWNERRGECWHGWPDEGQRAWPFGDELELSSAPRAPSGDPVDAEGADVGAPEVAFCKEFELR